MLVELQPAFILHTRPYRDSSLLADILSLDYGRLTLLVKGGRNPKNYQRYLLQPFRPLSVSWQGKSQLKTLVSLELNGQAFTLKERYLYSALYANELLNCLLLPGDPQQEIYHLYLSLLDDLFLKKNLEISLRCFEFDLLNVLGYGIDFENEFNTGKVIEDGNEYLFIVDSGFMRNTFESSGKLLTIQGSHLLAIAEGDFTRHEVRLTAKKIIRAALQPHLKGKALKSRELFR